MRTAALRRAPLLLLLGLVACGESDAAGPEDIEITSKTQISGSVNGSPLKGSVNATIQTGSGGNSTCSFPQLPAGFTPGTLGTHT